MTISGLADALIVPVAAGNNSPNSSPCAKFVFTTSFAKTPTSGLVCPTQERDVEWLAQQRAAVAAHRAAQHAAFVSKHETAHARAWCNENDRRAAATMLLQEAAARDLAFIKASVASSSPGTASQVTTFCRGTWSTLHTQAAKFFDALPVDPQQPHAGSQAALEIISSLALWHHGDGVSLPLRRYVLMLPGPGATDDAQPAAATLVPTPVLGLASFAYSTYILQLRQEAQLRLLSTLANQKAEI